MKHRPNPCVLHLSRGRSLLCIECMLTTVRCIDDVVAFLSGAVGGAHPAHTCEVAAHCDFGRRGGLFDWGWGCHALVPHVRHIVDLGQRLALEHFVRHRVRQNQMDSVSTVSFFSGVLCFALVWLNCGVRVSRKDTLIRMGGATQQCASLAAASHPLALSLSCSDPRDAAHFS